MKTLLLVACLLAAPGGDREQGLQLYQAGKFAEAAAAFRAAIEHDGDAPDLQWNLALASWQAGDLAAAETAAEKYAALAKDARVDLHRGLLGAVRHAEAHRLEAQADALLQGAGTPPAAAGAPEAAPPDPLPVLEQALAKAKQAKDHFVAGAAAKATPELLRNTERTLRYVDALQKKIDELKQQREQQPKDDDQKQDETQDEKDKPPEDQQDKGDKQDDKGEEGEKGEKGEKGDEQDQPGEPGEPEPGEGQQPPEPKPEDGKPEPKPAEDGAEPQPAEPEPAAEQQPEPPRGDAPGEVVEGKELTPEQAQRLLEQLKQLDARLHELRQGQKTGRRPVGRDW